MSTPFYFKLEMTTTPCGRDHQWEKKWFRVETLISNLTNVVFFVRSLIIVALKKFIHFVLSETQNSI
jgi:hypothetical protein